MTTTQTVSKSEMARQAAREALLAGEEIDGRRLHEQFGITTSLGRRVIRQMRVQLIEDGEIPMPEPRRPVHAARPDRSAELAREIEDLTHRNAAEPVEAVRAAMPRTPSREWPGTEPAVVPEPPEPEPPIVLLDETAEYRKAEPKPEQWVPDEVWNAAKHLAAEPDAEEQAAAEPPAEPDPRAVRLRRWTFAAVLLVALVAAVVSYAHQQALALAVGESWRSYLLPLSADGLIGAASWTLVARRREGKPAKLARFALVLGVVASVSANVASAWTHGPAGWLVALWAPVALILCIELLAQHVRRDTP